MEIFRNDVLILPPCKTLTDLEKPSDQILGKGVASPLRFSGVLIGGPIFWRWTASFTLSFLPSFYNVGGKGKKRKKKSTSTTGWK